MKELLLLTNISESAKELKDMLESINSVKNLLIASKETQNKLDKSFSKNFTKESEDALKIQLDIFSILHEEMLDIFNDLHEEMLNTFNELHEGILKNVKY
jgi:5,10-methylenetetrahydrofolate reductase